MTDKYNDEIIEEENQDTDDQTDDYEPEKFCTLCHRSERQAGKMIDLPNNIHICPDCMQRSFDSMNTQMQSGNFNYGDLFNMPNISMIDLNSLQNQIPNSQKIKKRSKKKEPKKVAYKDSGTWATTRYFPGSLIFTIHSAYSSPIPAFLQ